ncbi:unnamed protein product [Fusarium equiseti]|uniref:Uncharacterized protein n=1 Tax=Fusarium equiseti TaxID=61235 RepID=A0A8J2NK74_FUSEQ|nr:unnamed protein product [Fusarium equiseti]
MRGKRVSFTIQQIVPNYGPCKILEDGAEPTLREHSLNNHANVLYIDQPIGSGFSYGDGGKVSSTKQSSPYVWNFLQLWFEAFIEYDNRDLLVFTVSCGGHTGTDIVNYILDKNLEIRAGKTSGDVINVKAFSASNAWFDARIQEMAILDFALDNLYRPLINESLYKELLTEYKTEILLRLSAWYRSVVWTSAMDKYPDWIMADIQPGGVRPPTHHEKYLERPDVQKAIGARVNYTDSGGQFGIVNSGDDAKPFLGELSRIVRDGVQVLIWSGDFDYGSNWVGTKRVVDAVDWPRKKEFSGKGLKPYKAQGVQKATFNFVNNLHYVRVFNAGHNVWWYRKYEIRVTRTTY